MPTQPDPVVEQFRKHERAHNRPVFDDQIVFLHTLIERERPREGSTLATVTEWVKQFPRDKLLAMRYSDKVFIITAHPVTPPPDTV